MGIDTKKQILNKIKTKKQILRELGKKFIVEWEETILYREEIMAIDEEDVEDMFNNGDIIGENIINSNITEGSLEIIKI